MQKSIVQMILVVMSVVGVVGCTELSHRIPQGQNSIQALSTMPRHIHDLAGSWEFQDKTGAYSIRLNTEGEGSYDWKDGWFETLEVKEGAWKGRWLQAGNDREGEFELKWSSDSSVARGRWWYTRIGQDFNPLEPGGAFTMKRIASFLMTGK